MNVGRRLANLEAELERRHRIRSPVMRGALELHCPGGLGHIEGMACEEHEACAYTSSPIMGSIIRQYIFAWHEGMPPLDEMIG